MGKQQKKDRARESALMCLLAFWRKKICGFRGHKSELSQAFHGGQVYAIRLICKDCGHTTKWFPVRLAA